SIAGIRLASNELCRYGAKLDLPSAPNASAVSISPTCARTSERNRFRARPFVFIALAISMLPTGTSVVIGVSITPSHVISAITDPAPQAMEYVETRKASGIPLARRADVAPAATIIDANSKTL